MSPKAGGVSQALRNLIPNLIQLGCQNEVVCFDSSGEVYGVKDDFLVHKIGPSKTPYAYVAQYQSWLKQNIDKFDVVIIHGLWLYNSYGTYLFLKNIPNIKLYVMPHGMLDPYFQKTADRKLKAFRNEIIWSMLEKKVINNATGVLFTCEREMDLANETFKNYHPRKKINVGMGVAKPPVFKQEMQDEFLKIAQLKKDEPYWLFLSRIDIKKGIDLLLQAYKKLSQNNSNLPKLVVAGPIESSYAQDLIQTYGGEKNILFTGMLLGNAKWGAIYAAAVFILPSHQENFGIAVVEAMACAIPVAITNQVNIYPEIEKANAGFIFNDNEAGLELVLNKLINVSQEELTTIGNNALQCYDDLYTPLDAAHNFMNKI
ncbi:glycosyltransferase [Rhizosphaericola mali]|nr:glycosyltransferase [Rhizosphaericola mali]